MKRSLLLSLLIPALLFVPAGADDPPADRGRFDLSVREDIFNGFAGDPKSLARGIQTCDDVLKKNPKNAEALVWRGAARSYQAGMLFQQGKRTEALPLCTSGQKDMDDAVSLESKNPSVRIPRSLMLLAAVRRTSAEIGKPLLEKAREDLELIYEAQKDRLDKLGTHPRGELHMALAEVFHRTGDRDKSHEQLNAILKAIPDSKYAEQAKEWLAAKPDAKLQHSCIGCHAKK